jgi:hypothetical protein
VLSVGRRPISWCRYLHLVCPWKWVRVRSNPPEIRAIAFLIDSVIMESVGITVLRML